MIKGVQSCSQTLSKESCKNNFKENVLRRQNYFYKFLKMY